MPSTSPRLRPPADPAYRAAYERGWRYSNSGRDSVSLDHLDRKGATEAEYDGYMDAAAGRPKWHIPNCRGHDYCPANWAGPDGRAAREAWLAAFEDEDPAAWQAWLAGYIAACRAARAARR